MIWFIQSIEKNSEFQNKLYKVPQINECNAHTISNSVLWKCNPLKTWDPFTTIQSNA